MKKFNKIVIYGTGFMGASLAKDIKAEGIAESVWGITRGESRNEDIRRLSIFDEVTSSLEEGLRDADLLILCMPVATMIKDCFAVLDEYFSAHADADTIITDIGSVKAAVLSAVERTSIKNRFIGAHPICGSEKNGAYNSVAGLYSGAVCIVTGSSNEPALKKVSDFWKAAGCEVVIMTAAQHDKILAETSHLPHAISFAYADYVNADNVKYSAGSFKDMVRISKSDRKLWDGIFYNNKKEVAAAIEGYISSLTELKNKIFRGSDDNSD